MRWDLEPGPLLLPPDLRLTPELYACGEDLVYERVCQANPEAVLELAADGTLLLLTPTASKTSRRNSKITYPLCAFGKRQPRWRIFDSSGGFRQPELLAKKTFGPTCCFGFSAKTNFA